MQYVLYTAKKKDAGAKKKKTFGIIKWNTWRPYDNTC
jgi:hypothetical protein